VNDGVGVVGGAEKAGENVTAGGSRRTGAGGGLGGAVAADGGLGGAVAAGAGSNTTAGGG
jgi:hypothetical protein